MQTALIVGVAGTVLSDAEKAFLQEVRPAGLILFTRNFEAHDQIRALVTDVRDAVGAEDFLVLIDQEGGRVQRLRPPLARALPPGAAYGRLYARDPEAGIEAAFAVSRLLAADLKALGIDTNCVPVLDLPVPGADAVIGDRAYATTIEPVVRLGLAVAEGHMAGGMLPIIKHIPGHGRANCDSHLALPLVTESRETLSATDFAPFKALAGLPAAMSAHVVYTALDPDAPASISAKVTSDVIRGEIGFDGLLMSDDLSMHALSGTMRERAERVVASGSDLVLHCNGDMAEMQEAAAGTPPLADRALARFKAAAAVVNHDEPFDSAAAEAHLARVLAIAADRAESV